MTIPTIKGTGDVQRKMLACAIDISSTDTPDYLVIGYKITSSAVEFNPEVESGTDINGRNFGSVNKFEPTQSFEPHRLTAGDLGALGEKLLHYFRYQELEKFSKFKCILIYGFLGDLGAYPADVYDACTITPNSLGGESWTEMPFDVTFGGDVKHGYVDKLIDKVTFVEVLVPVTSIALNKSTLTLSIGDSETLTVTFSPANASNKQLTWISSAPEVASVDLSGKVTGVSAGPATITATSVDGQKEDICTVTVSGS